MNITILKENNDETRVAITPDIAKSLIGLGFEVLVESNAGELATISDDKLAASGAKIISNRDELLTIGDIFFFINSPSEEDIKKMKKGAIVIGYLNALTDKEYISKLAQQLITGYSLELMPRVSRAQSMDILSSQNNISGYRAIIEASHAYGGLFPMMMTAAGSISPARVFVIGVGVAGLQAIATAKRLGAIVTAYDVRAATKEQVESLGGRFLVVDEENSKDAETSSGYAKEMDSSYKVKERNALLSHLKTQNIVITTALIPAKKAPILIDDEMLDVMANQGTIIVDLAAENGGNTTQTKLGEINNYKGIKIIGYGNLAKKAPFDASKMFAKNIFNFILPHTKDGILNMNIEDETVAKTLVTDNGIIITD